jgi:hypothetical protein
VNLEEASGGVARSSGGASSGRRARPAREEQAASRPAGASAREAAATRQRCVWPKAGARLSSVREEEAATWWGNRLSKLNWSLQEAIWSLKPLNYGRESRN